MEKQLPAFKKFLYIIVISLLPNVLDPVFSYGQNKLNYGLKDSQAPSTLPHSAVTAEKPVLKAKVPAKTVLQKNKDGEWTIRGGWELVEASKVKFTGEMLSAPGVNTSDWYNAVVPGTVLTTLVQQGVYPDPYYGLNNLSIPDSLCREDWWYRTTFTIPEKHRRQNTWLNFKGINYQAEVWLNGHLLGKIKGAFIRGIFEVSRYLHTSGINVLAVHIIPPPHPGIPHEESPLAGPGPNGGQLCLDGPTFISSEGWDWIPGVRDRNIGIWQDVTLRFTGAVVLQDPQVITDLPLPDTTYAGITIKTNIYNSSNVKQKVRLTAKIEKITAEQTVELAAGETRKVSFSPAVFPSLKIKDPRLWWPNGYGSPELYNLKLTVTGSEGLEDSRNVRFGIRELSYELTVDEPHKQGQRIEFNPVKVFSKVQKPVFDPVNRRRVTGQTFVPSLKKGVNPNLLQSLPPGPTSPYLVIKVNGKRIFCRGGNWGMDDGMKRVSRERLEPYFRLHKEANFNMIRNWTGESTEEVFYDLCDEYGMLVWNDFWLSTEGFNLEPEDNALFLSNARDVITRFCNHPSIAIWCPRNEGYAPATLDDSLATLVATLDGTRYYQPNSRYLNLRTSGPWNYLKYPSVYFTELAGGFSTELGTPSIPTAASMRKMMATEDVWPISDVWFYHDLHNGQKEYLQAIDSLYGKPENLDDFCKKAQMINYDSHRAMFEAWNSKLWNNTSGLLIWMSHPAWPSTVWQAYSWDYETFGSYFGAKKACEPVHIQMNMDDNDVVVVNTSLKEMEVCRASLTVYNIKGRSVYHKTMDVNVQPNHLSKVFNASLPTGLTGNYLVRLQLTDQSGKIIAENDYWRNFGNSKNFLEFNSLGSAVLTAKPDPASPEKFTLTNNSTVPAIAVKLNLSDKNERIILPAYFSDGYFNLLPGESKSITFSSPVKDAALISAEGYNFKRQQVLRITKKH